MNLINKLKHYISLSEPCSFETTNLVRIRDNILFSFNYWTESNSFSSYQDVLAQLAYFLDIESIDSLGDDSTLYPSVNNSLIELVLALSSPSPNIIKIKSEARQLFILLLGEILN